MTARGDIILARFPLTDGTGAKLRPVLALAQVPGAHGDYLVLFISSQLSQAVAGVDIVLGRSDPTFIRSGLKVPSVLRIGKIASISRRLIVGPLGQLDDAIFDDVIRKLTALLNDAS